MLTGEAGLSPWWDSHGEDHAIDDGVEILGVKRADLVQIEEGLDVVSGETGLLLDLAERRGRCRLARVQTAGHWLPDAGKDAVGRARVLFAIASPS